MLFIMAFELQGTLHKVFETQSFGANGFTKRDFVVMIDEDSKYPQPIRLNLIKDKCDSINDFSVGDKVRVQFDLRGNEHNDRFYTDLQAWRIEKANNSGGGAQGGGGGQGHQQQPQSGGGSSEPDQGGRAVSNDLDEYF